MRRIKQDNPNTPQAFDKLWMDDMAAGRRQFDMYRFKAMLDGVPFDGRMVELGSGCSEFLTYSLNHRTVVSIVDGTSICKLEAHGLDYSKWAVSYMKQIDPRIHYRVGNALETDYPTGYFDAVLAGEIIEHLEEPELLIAEMARLTHPGGFFRITTLLTALQSTDHYHVWEFDPNDLLVMFKNHATGNKSARVDVVGNYFVATGWR